MESNIERERVIHDPLRRKFVDYEVAVDWYKSSTTIDVKIYWSDSCFAISQSNFESNVCTIKSFQSRASSIVTWI